MAEEEIDVPAIAARFLSQAPPLQFPPVLDGKSATVGSSHRAAVGGLPIHVAAVCTPYKVLGVRPYRLLGVVPCESVPPSHTNHCHPPSSVSECQWDWLGSARLDALR